MSAKNVIGTAIVGVTVDSILSKAWKFFQENGGDDLIKAHTGGKGVNDETLMQDACALAVSGGHISLSEMNKIMEVYGTLTDSERRRAVMVVGKSEDNYVVEEPIILNGVVACDKNNKPLFKKTTMSGNVRGARSIALMGKMSKEEIKAFLLGTNALDTSGKRLEETMTNITKGFNAVIENPTIKGVINDINAGGEALKKDLEARMSERNSLDDWAESLRKKAKEPKKRSFFARLFGLNRNI